MFAARVVEVVITSPEDIDRFRTAIGDALNWWNSACAKAHRFVLIHSGGQHSTTDAERLDQSEEPVQIVDRGDVFIAIFDPLRRTGADVMGDVERAKRAGKSVFAWLVAEPSSHSLSAEDQVRLDDVTQRLAKEGVWPRYIGSWRCARRKPAAKRDYGQSDLHQSQRVDRGIRKRYGSTPSDDLPDAGGAAGPADLGRNHSTSLAVGLKVTVDAVDSEGNDLPDGARRSRQAIADVFAKLRTGPWPDEHHLLTDPDGVLRAGRPKFLTNRMDILAAHNALDFTRWLRPNQHASALYSLEAKTFPRVRIQFEDEAGQVWSRTNDAEPERVSSTSPARGELSPTAVIGE